jgi:hypothetical protein
MFSKLHGEHVIEESPLLEENSPQKKMSVSDPANFSFKVKLDQ